MYGAIPDAAEEEIDAKVGVVECVEREVQPTDKDSFIVNVKQVQVILHIKRRERYGEHEKEQTGVLAAWDWGASKILDALSQGLGAKLGINPKQSILGGVSRYGKAVAVAGAFDQRFSVLVSACLGAGGISLSAPFYDTPL
jgi:hypothetical protein